MDEPVDQNDGAALRTTEARVLRAALLADETEWDRFLGKVPGEEFRTEIIGTAFLLVARRRFGPETDIRTITRYVAELSARQPADEPLPRREAEAMLRAVILGEVRLGFAVDDETAVEVERRLLFAMVAELALSDGEVESMVRDAEKLLQQFSSIQADGEVGDP